MKKKLYIDMVPKTSWFNNLRSLLTEDEWKKVRTDIYKKNNFKCEICGGKGNKHPVEAHERWEYNKNTQIQKLINIEALCPDCHLVTHIGFARISNKFDYAIEHLKKVNKWDDTQAKNELENSLFIWNELNEIEWKIDMSWLLNKYNFSKKTIQKLNQIN